MTKKGKLKTRNSWHEAPENKDYSFEESPHNTMKTKTTLASLIKAKKFDWVNPNIEKHFILEDVRGSDYRLFSFNKSISSEDAIEEMNREGYVAANLHELLLWEDWNDIDWVVALGRTARVNGNLNVPCLLGRGAGRRLDLGWWDGGWPALWRLLGVRDSSPTLDAKDGALSPSESFTLESRVRKLEEFEERVRKFLIL